MVKAIEPPPNLTINGVFDDEVILQLHDLQVATLIDPIETRKMMICFHQKKMRTHFELAKGDREEGMNPVPTCVCGSNNKPPSHLHEVLLVESHLRVKTQGPLKVSLGYLNVISINVQSDNHVQILFQQQEVVGHV